MKLFPLRLFRRLCAKLVVRIVTVTRAPPRSSPSSPSFTTTMDPVPAAASLPHEIWFYIHRLATGDTSPLVVAHADWFQYKPVTDPLEEIARFWRDASSLVLVCRLWNSLANELLYENIRVDENFDSLLRPSLENPANANLVRSVRLSPTRFDHNYAILALCPRIQLIVQPEASKKDLVFHALDAGIDTAPLSLSQSLTHIYWSESEMTSALLRKLITLAPTLESLFLMNSAVLQSDPEAMTFPPIPRLRRLGLVPASLSLTTSILQINLQNLTRLTCSPSLFLISDAPIFPSVRTLELFGSRSTIQFAGIFARCPRLRELCYDVWNGILELEDEQRSHLECIRLHSAVTVIRDWSSITSHFALFVSPQFPKFQRLVLHGSWYRVVDDAAFAPSRQNLRTLGCQLEFPEGIVR
ncbi:hypothetical protein K438DRAFT_1124270 [Mycena galopus ATCC 62051]|nr:hypothetical protein K438DRAFT_1124270 [Mycena galopus ATCC 62051]